MSPSARFADRFRGTPGSDEPRRSCTRLTQRHKPILVWSSVRKVCDRIYNRMEDTTPMGGDQQDQRRKGPTLTAKDLTEAEEERYKLARLRVVGLALEFGFTTIGVLVICLFGGIWLDRRLGTTRS